MSPLYSRVVTENGDYLDGSQSALHARHIHGRMYAEYVTAASHGQTAPSKKFVPVVMSGATPSDVPPWLGRSSKQIFVWPQQYKHLLFFMLQPARVIADFISRRDRALETGRY